MEPRLFDYPVHIVSHGEGLQRVAQTLDARQNLHVVTLNPEMLMRAEHDAELSQILKTAGLVLPDGAGVVWALRKRGFSTVRRVPGIEFSEEVLAWAAKNGRSVALVGAKQEVLALAVENLKQRYPGLNVAYAHHGFFKPGPEEEQIVRDCAAARPDVVFVALGVPRQEKWIAEHGNLFTGAVFIGVGGSLDVWSGSTRRAPALFRKLNLEWLYRITSEPWRIKRTYKILPMFVVKVLMSKA